MNNASIEQRLRSHYSAVELHAVISDAEFDPTPMLRTVPADRHSNRWRLVGAVAAAVVTVGGLGYLSLRPEVVTPAQVPAPPLTLAGETDEQASFRIWSECMTGHGVTLADSRGEDGGIEFSGTTDEATQLAVDECQAVLVAAGLAQP